MLTSQPFGRLLEPGLRKIFQETYSELPEQYSQVFNVQDSKKAIETDLRMGGFGLWDKKDSAGSVVYDDPTGTQALQYVHEEFSKGFTVERKFIDDEQYGTISKWTKSLARTARATIETQAASVLNTAFEGATGAINGFDGKPLISTAHNRLDGGTMSNRLAATDGGTVNGALNDANLKAAVIQMARQVDDRGLLIQVQPKILVVPRSLQFIANTLVQSNNVSVNGTGSGMTNDKNTLPNLKVVVLDYLTYTKSATAYPWFLIDPQVAELNFFWRRKLEFSNTEDFDTMQAKYRGYMRFSAGYSDFRGIFGSDGSNS
jgi:phage major head subunit gpT-like protein